ncbi:RICIN domain-containing protein [Actinomadura opuntiae]|uniref:RICIN domain-containing protein n=1 Tax=Actinomadura sp. OS1-43 TaxID=604315 RepID=UPI00255AA8BB|nr:RICIN domain-containing protein [Actinomadura sp. OS1-43]MDL4818540.1 RICIN domain-containing protein [Actinomadura sp. OS1-43]
MPTIPHEVSDGVKIAVHEVTGTYLFMDNWYDYLNDDVQTWNEDPLPTGDKAGHRWYFAPEGGDIYRIESGVHRYCLTAGTTAGAHPVLQERSKSVAPRQRWHLRSVLGSSDFAIIPQLYPDYALGIEGNYQANNQYVKPIRMWAGEPTLSQAWIIADAPDS